jgi:hypothetical protein
MVMSELNFLPRMEMLDKQIEQESDVERGEYVGEAGTGFE